jgi:putative hydrolase of the HAD superfamily
MRKPDPGIFLLALGIAQAKPEECIYFDDRLMLVQTAQNLDIRSFHHQDFLATKKILEGLKDQK